MAMVAAGRTTTNLFGGPGRRQEPVTSAGHPVWSVTSLAAAAGGGVIWGLEAQ